MEWWIMSFFATFFLSQMNIAESYVNDVYEQNALIASSYTAEASIEKSLLDIKSQDVDNISTFQNKANLWLQKDSEYWFFNSSDTGYFDLTLNNKPSVEIDLWKTEWMELDFSETEFTDYFDTLNINYNLWSDDAKLVVDVVKQKKTWNFTSCNFEDVLDLNCTDTVKSVVYTAEAWQNWVPVNWTTPYFEWWENDFKNKLRISWFDPDHYNYIISVNTLNLENTNFSYYVTHNWVKKTVANNVIEIDTVWTTQWNYARMKLQKDITNKIQPNSKYVLFSNWEIAK